MGAAGCFWEPWSEWAVEGGCGANLSLGAQNSTWDHRPALRSPHTPALTLYRRRQAEGVGRTCWSGPGGSSMAAPTVHRERMNLKAPIYFSTGLTEKANHYYKLFITWTNQKIRKTFVQRNMFEFKHIKAFDRAFADNPGPMVRPWPGRVGVRSSSLSGACRGPCL